MLWHSSLSHPFYISPLFFSHSLPLSLQVWPFFYIFILKLFASISNVHVKHGTFFPNFEETISMCALKQSFHGGRADNFGIRRYEIPICLNANGSLTNPHRNLEVQDSISWETMCATLQNGATCFRTPVDSAMERQENKHLLSLRFRSLDF